MANGGLQRMDMGFPKRKLNLNPIESKNLSVFRFAKIDGIRQHLDSYSKSVTSLASSR